MRKKRLVAMGLVLLLTSSMLTGCGDTQDIESLNKMQSLNSESNAKDNYKLSYSDKQDMIYAQVSDRTLLDLSALDACDDNEVQEVVNYMDAVDAVLEGGTAKEDGVIDSKFTDYLLAEFEKTPYYWQRQRTTIRGIDSSSRAIVVDVVYHTIDFEKTVIPDSTIAKGCDNYDKLMATRYTRYCSILQTKYQNPQSDWQSQMTQFEKVYGKASDIYESQRNITLTDTVFETGNQRTYNGVIDTEAEKSGASMTVRYVLVPNYVLGVNLGLVCEHMYVTNYKLDNDVTEGLSIFNEEGYATITDNVYALLYSYFTAIDEANFAGLYKLTSNFENIDKYWDDVFDTTYFKHENFTLSVFSINGTNVTCGVTVASKVRGKGTDITMPNYKDRYYFELELNDEKLKVKNMVLLSREIVGEPAITTQDAGTSGFAASIELDNDDKVAIENLICNFGSLQLLGDVTSDDFGDVVDISMSANDLNLLKDNMITTVGRVATNKDAEGENDTTKVTIDAKKKVVFLLNYMQGTSNYASVKCRELFQADNNSITEATSVYDFILKGGKWYIMKYAPENVVKLDTTNLTTTGSLCLVSPGKVESYTSQVKGTASTSIDTASDTSVSFDHEVKMPVLKSGTKEEGVKLLTGSDISDDTFAEQLIMYGFGATDFDETGVEDVDSLLSDGKSLLKDVIAYFENVNSGAYTVDDEEDRLAAKDELANRCRDFSSDLRNASGTVDTADTGVSFDNLADAFASLEDTMIQAN